MSITFRFPVFNVVRQKAHQRCKMTFTAGENVFLQVVANEVRSNFTFCQKSDWFNKWVQATRRHNRLQCFVAIDKYCEQRARWTISHYWMCRDYNYTAIVVLFCLKFSKQKLTSATSWIGKGWQSIKAKTESTTKPMERGTYCKQDVVIEKETWSTNLDLDTLKSGGCESVATPAPTVRGNSPFDHLIEANRTQWTLKINMKPTAWRGQLTGRVLMQDNQDSHGVLKHTAVAVATFLSSVCFGHILPD